MQVTFKKDYNSRQVVITRSGRNVVTDFASNMRAEWMGDNLSVWHLNEVRVNAIPWQDIQSYNYDITTKEQAVSYIATVFKNEDLNTVDGGYL